MDPKNFGFRETERSCRVHEHTKAIQVLYSETLLSLKSRVLDYNIYGICVDVYDPCLVE